MKKKNKPLQQNVIKILAAVLLVLLLVALLIGLFSHKKALPTAPKGVWWWDSNLPSEQYLSFTRAQGINEIYYCDSSFGEKTANFIKTARRYGCKVYWLAGEYQWLTDDSGLIQSLKRYQNYQTLNPDAQFAGVHLDIEPHQDPNFKTKRTELLTSLVTLVKSLKNNNPLIAFDYDIPFWLDDELTIEGSTQPAYAHIIEIADRTFIMSYRDTATDIYNTAKDEVAYAITRNKTIFLGVETYSTEGDFVSFQEEGKYYMNAELEKLRSMIPDNFGVAIHQIKTWYDLKN